MKNGFDHSWKRSAENIDLLKHRETIETYELSFSETLKSHKYTIRKKKIIQMKDWRKLKASRIETH